MASKFMAFEGMAATSSAWDDDYNQMDENTNESTEMNSMQYPNYQSNQNNGQTAVEPSPYGAVGDENDLNENLDEKCDKSVGYRKFIHRNSEQFKSICGGLLLLMGCGIHIVWGIFRVFNWSRCDEDKSSVYLRFVIWSWYIGAILGCFAAGYIVTKLRKRQIYLIGGVLLLLSGILIALSDKPDPNIFILLSRLIGGFTQGLTYVVVVVHASENATKEFRDFLMLIVGAVINYSILISVLAFFHTEKLMTLSLLNGLSLFMFGICSMIITSKHATETIPFILLNTGSEMDALQTMSKLKKLPIAAPSVHHEFLVLKNLVQDQLDHYGMPSFRKILLPENRKSLIFCCYSRLCSVLSLNLPLIVMIMLFLRVWVDDSAKNNGVDVTDYCKPLFTEPNFISTTETPIPTKATIEVIPTPDVSPVKITPKRPKRDTNESPKEERKGPEESSSKKETDVGKDPGKAEDKLDKKKEITNDENKKDENQEKKPNKPEGESKPNDNSKLKSNQNEDKKKQLIVDTENDSKQKPQHNKDKMAAASNNDKQPDKKPNEKSSSDKTSDNSKNKPKSENESKEKPENEKKANADIVGLTFIGHLITFIHSRELTLILLAWFVFGTLTASILYALNLRRFIYYTTCALSSALALTGLFRSFSAFSSILHFSLIVYFNYVTIPIDLFSHCILAEAFPITLKAYSVAGVVIIENIVHIILIGLYMTEWFHDWIILFMCIVAFISYEIARNLPQRNDLSLAEAREQYQHINLMLFNEPKIANNQQQEFI